MTIKRYLLNYGWDDIEVVVDIDHDICTTEFLTTINEFWAGDKRRLSSAGGDVLKAVLKMLCTKVLALSMTYSNVKAQFEDKSITEGWPPLDGSCGITLVRYDTFELEDDEVEIEEIPR